jgi:hypothetical protein
MGDILFDREKGIGQDIGNADVAKGLNKPFVLSDVSKEELSKRRIPIYSYLL